MFWRIEHRKRGQELIDTLWNVNTINVGNLENQEEN